MTMHRSPDSNSKIGLISVKKFAVLVILMSLFFIAGLLLGYFTFFNKVKTSKCPIINIDLFSKDVTSDHDAIEVSSYEHLNLGQLSNDIPDFLIKPHLLNEQSVNEIRKELKIHDSTEVSMNKYLIAIPKNRKSSIKFLSDDEMLSRQLLKGDTLFNLFNGLVKARVVLIEGRSKFEELDISSIKGSIILTCIDQLSFHKIMFYESLGAKAVLLYTEKSLRNCQFNNSQMHDKPYWWCIDPSTPGYVAIEEISKLPPQKWNFPQIPVVKIPCQVVLDIQPYLTLKKDLVGELEVFSTLINITSSNLIISIPGLKQPDLSITMGSSRNNMFGTRRLVRMLRSLSSTIDSGWAPSFTLTFVSWDSRGYGLSEFIESYGSMKKERIMMYIDLNQYVADNGVDHLMTSLSLENFVKTILGKASMSINIRRPKNSGIRSTDLLTGFILEQQCGIPFLQSFSSNEYSDEAEILKMFGAVTMAASTTDAVQISLQKTVGEISKAVKHFVHLYPGVKGHVAALPQLFHQIRTSLENFDNSLKSPSNISLGLMRMSNIIKADIENTLKISLHRLRHLTNNPVSKFLQMNNSHVGRDVYAKIFRNFFENDFVNKCPDQNNLLTCATYEMSLLLAKLYNILHILH